MKPSESLAKAMPIQWCQAPPYALWVLDIFSFCISAYIAYLWSMYYSGSISVFNDWISIQDMERFIACLALVCLGCTVSAVHYHHYNERKPFWDELGETWKLLAFLALCDIALVAITKWNASRLWWGIFWLHTALLIPCLRNFGKRIMQRLGIWDWPVIIVGTKKNAQETILAIQSEPLMGLCVYAHFPAHCHDKKVILQYTQLPNVQFILALEHEQSEERDQWIRYLTHIGIKHLSIVPSMRGIPLYHTKISHFFSHEIALLTIKNHLSHPIAAIVKRCFDIIVSAFLLVLLSPIILGLMIIIQRDGGSAFFSQIRIGKNRQPFRCYKFRSMVPDAQEQLKNILSSCETSKKIWENDHKLRHDPRITRLGTYLRKTSLDELPQLWNVLCGDMSLVGPRPITKKELSNYQDDVSYYLMVRPGMTGLWQVSGRNDLDYTTRVYLDVWYIKNWSLWYDIVLLFKTYRAIFSQKGAY